MTSFLSLVGSISNGLALTIIPSGRTRFVWGTLNLAPPEGVELMCSSWCGEKLGKIMECDATFYRNAF